MSDTKRCGSGDRWGLVLRPWFVVSLGLLVANDWFLKGEFGNSVTGKLSDVAGLGLVAFVLSQVGLVSGRCRLWLTVLALGVTIFVAVKTVPSITGAVESVLDALLPWENRIVVDPTDVLTLLVVPVAWWRGQISSPLRPQLPAEGGALRWGLAGVALTACLASGYHDIEHVLRVEGDGDVLVVEVVDESYIASSDYFRPDRVDSDGTWIGGTASRAEVLNVDLEELLAATTNESCQHDNSSHCVRLLHFSIEESFDEGLTWTRVWVLDGDSKYRDKDWVASQFYYLDRSPGFRQIALTNDGTIVAILAPDVFVFRSSAGQWNLTEASFRPIPAGLMVQLVGGFAFLSLLAVVVQRLMPELTVAPWVSTGTVVLLVIVGQTGFWAVVMTLPLVIVGFVCAVKCLVGASEPGVGRARSVLTGVIIPGLVTAFGLWLAIDWRTNDGNLDHRRWWHILAVAIGVVMIGAVHAVGRFRSSSAIADGSNI